MDTQQWLVIAVIIFGLAYPVHNYLEHGKRKFTLLYQSLAALSLPVMILYHNSFLIIAASLLAVAANCAPQEKAKATKK